MRRSGSPRGNRFRSQSRGRRNAPWWQRGLSMVADNPMTIGAVGGALSSAAAYMNTSGTTRRSQSAPPAGFRESRILNPPSRGKIMGSARYAGRFKKPSRKGVKAGGKFTTFATQEVSGTVTDANCVYLTHTAMDPYLAIRFITQEMIRKLMARAGFVVHSPNETFQSNNSVTSTAGFSIRVFQMEMATNTYSLGIAHIFGTTETLNTLTTIILPYFIQYSSGYTSAPGGGNDSNAIEPTQMCLFDNKTQESLSSTVDFRLEKITIYSKSVLKVQNRTLSGDGTASTDNVNANPLQGYIYTFNGVPKAKPKSMFAFNRIQTNLGVSLIKGSSLPLEQGLREPPLPRLFWNCRKSSQVKLQPGNIKSCVITDKMTKNILDIFKKIRHQNTASPEFELTYSPFNHQMVALEEMINVDPEESITVSYEVDRKYYVKSQTKKPAGTAMANFIIQTLDNIV